MHSIYLLSAAVLLGGYSLAIWSDRLSDSLSPLKIWGALGILTSCPYILLLGYGLSTPHPLIAAAIPSSEFDLWVLRFACGQAVAVIPVIVGYRLVLGRTLAFNLPRTDTPQMDVWLTPICIATAVMGALLWGWLIVALGGVTAILSNIHLRTQMFAGYGYQMQLGSAFLTLAALLSVYRIRFADTVWSKLLAVGLIIAVGAVLTISGGRKSTMYLVLGAVFVWHFSVRRITKPIWPLTGIGVVLAAYFLVVLILRAPGALDATVVDPSVLLASIGDSATLFFENLSYVDGFVYTLWKFSRDGLWFGATWLDLLYSPLPSSVITSKPPIDDGVYLRSLAEGMRVVPGMSASALYPSSWPPETFGAGFMNFGWPGVALYHLVLGMMFRVVYEYLRRSPSSFFAIYLYAQIVLNFEISNLRIVQALMTVLTVSGVVGSLMIANRWRRIVREA